MVRDVPYDVLIVGAGYWGVATALVAERRGASVVLVDSERKESGSQAASGHFAFGWYKGPWVHRVRAAYEQAELFGVLFRHTGAIVNTKRQREQGDFYTGRERSDWYTFQPPNFLGLRKPDLASEVKAVGSDGPGKAWAEFNGKRLHARCVVVAAGCWTDELLAASNLPTLGVTHLRGTGAIYAGRVPVEGKVFLHELNPFKQFAIREWGNGKYRVGETSEAVLNRPPSEYVADMLRKVRGHLPNEGWVRPLQLISGRRPLLESGPSVLEVVPGVVAATGGGRIGAVLGFWAAGEALRLGGIT
jgi:glycine/D-amino acid oxidase-like deaminating enzyme